MVKTLISELTAAKNPLSSPKCRKSLLQWPPNKNLDQANQYFSNDWGIFTCPLADYIKTPYVQASPMLHYLSQRKKSNNKGHKVLVTFTRPYVDFLACSKCKKGDVSSNVPVVNLSGRINNRSVAFLKEVFIDEGTQELIDEYFN